MKNNPMSGFTLIELLVTLAVIGILAGLLLPSLSRAKAKTQQVGCVNKIRQWEIAMLSYVHENDDGLPREDGIDDVNSWAVAMAPTNQNVWYNCVAEAMPTRSVAGYGQNPLSDEFYSGSSAFRCPTAKFPDTTVNHPIFSLVVNSQLIDFDDVETKMQWIAEPSLTALFVDCGVPGETKAYPTQKEYNGQPKAQANRFSARHNNGGNIGMADGSVHHFPASKVVNPADGRSIWPQKDVIWTRRRDIKP